MKLDTVLNYINLALNYPALTYEDISLYFDMGIAELNTTLHTSIPTVSDMIKTFRQTLSTNAHSIFLKQDPEKGNYYIQHDYDTNSLGYYYSDDEKVFKVKNSATGEWESYPKLLGTYIRHGEKEEYYSVINDGDVYWLKRQTLAADNNNCEISEYLPDEWILLWLIPYICFKYTIRDGGTAQTFAEELQQGFQQLQETYDVPYRVKLATYADRLAYKDDVKAFLPNLNVMVKTKAIYSEMKHDRNVQAVYGNMFDRGGFLND